MIKAIIFDCFGVLVGKGYWKVWEAAGGDPIKDNDFIEEMLHKANAGEISREEFNSTMSRKLNLSVDEYQEIYEREEQPNKPLFEYIATELKQKYKIALLTNVNKGIIERRIPKELRELFDLIIISAEVGLQKPDPKIFELATTELGVKFEETVFTDDLARYVAPAAELGIKAILYTDFDSFKLQLEQVVN